MTLFLLSQKAKELGYDEIRAKSVLSLGGKLFDYYRTSIEESFNCRVFDTYGCGEGMGVSSQKDLDYMYIREIFKRLDEHSYWHKEHINQSVWNEYKSTITDLFSYFDAVIPARR